MRRLQPISPLGTTRLAFPRAAGYNHQDSNHPSFGGGQTVPAMPPTRQERESMPAPERMPICRSNLLFGEMKLIAEGWPLAPHLGDKE